MAVTPASKARVEMICACRREPQQGQDREAEDHRGDEDPRAVGVVRRCLASSFPNQPCNTALLNAAT
jgi:hypothetical protein